MTTRPGKFGRSALALFAAAGIAGAAADRPASSYFAPGPIEGANAIDITSRDVAASNEKVRMAHAALTAMWTSHFREVGARFAVPGLVRYRGGAASACGFMYRNNAGYCPGDNTIYFDEIFVAAQAKAAARQLGTDGDMAVVGIIAHEMGHAVALQLGYRSRTTYANEATADCLAGAFAEQAKRDGSLERGDIEEAFFGMASAGDPTPELTGDSRLDQTILRNASRMGHGTREQRTENFRQGLEGGAGACLDEFRS
ncbi:MAG: neutral zinc metallopeptidase [Gemmatimonadales bacterium]